MPWGTPKDFIPWGKRDLEPEPRIHNELTDEARVRIARTLEVSTGTGTIKNTWAQYRTETTDIPTDFGNPGFRESQNQFIKQEDDEEVLRYLEILLNILWEKRPDHSTKSLLKLDATIRRILREERILIRIRPEHEELKDTKTHASYALQKYKPSRDGSIRFDTLADETIRVADQELRVLNKNTRWQEPLEGYNEAWELYQEGNFTKVIPEKLYNSVEAVTQKICVKLEGWDNETDTVGTYLSTMREKGLFDPNDTMVGEWQQIMGGIRTGVQKTGGDRDRHSNIDQDYCLLLLHQVSAFLTFVINRYESKYG